MDSMITKLRDAGEFYAAGLLECPDKTLLWSFSHATAEFFKTCALPAYDGGRLYPCGFSFTNCSSLGAVPEYAFTWRYHAGEIGKKVPEAVPALNAIAGKVAPIHTPHTVGGAGYTHSFINFRRILSDGLLGYRARVDALPEGDFRESMTMLLDGIEVLKQRCVAYLTEQNARPELIAALEWVPNHTPRNIYEALVAWNFVYYVDGCDDLGGLDRGLVPYWNGEDVTDLIHELYTHVRSRSSDDSVFDCQ